MLHKHMNIRDKNGFYPSAKSICYAILISSMAFSTAPLYAQFGPDGPGPGPEFNNQGEETQNGYGNENIYGVKNLAYYGDWDSNRVFIIDIDNMELLPTVEGTGDGPYGIDQQDRRKAYALTRKVESLTIVDNYTITNEGKIILDHKPRSTNFNPYTGLSLVSGADKVMSSIIRVNSDKVMDVFGYDEPAIHHNHDYGGSLATGHPLWISDERFFMLDRVERQIQLWSGKRGLLSVILTPTSVHHIFQSPLDAGSHIYYAVVEGNRGDLISPSILRFNILNGRMEVTGEAVLSDYNPDQLDPPLLNPAVMGSHHADFHPDGVHIYIGSAEGHVFVVNKDSMEIVTMIDTGAGSGHTTFAPMRNLAFVTNHNSRYMSVINTTDHTLVKNIVVADSASSEYKSQSHTSSVSPDMRYFYSAASHDGVFFEIDMETLEISGTVPINDTLEPGDHANILMGSFIWDGDGENM